MTTLKVALLQLLSPGADEERALVLGEQAVRQAAAAGADIALFPEMWQIGYSHCPSDPQGRSAWAEHATATDGPFVSRFQEIARELNIAIVVTYLQEWPGSPRNAATLIDRHGECLATYAKVHTCDYWMEEALTPGDALAVVPLDTAAGPVSTGMMVCYDREFPETARLLMLQGAELVLVPNACHLTLDRLMQFRTRAFENMFAVAMANYATAPDQAREEYPLDCNGHSVAYGGVCFAPDRTPLDQTLVMAGETPGVHVAALDLDALRAYRSLEVWGDAYRKPHMYRALVEDAPQPVFVRPDSRRGPLLPGRAP